MKSILIFISFIFASYKAVELKKENDQLIQIIESNIVKIDKLGKVNDTLCSSLSIKLKTLKTIKHEIIQRDL